MMAQTGITKPSVQRAPAVLYGESWYAAAAHAVPLCAGRSGSRPPFWAMGWRPAAARPGSSPLPERARCWLLDRGVFPPPETHGGPVAAGTIRAGV